MLRPLPQADLDHILQHTEKLWRSHERCRIFLTGGTGFFGKWLQESFAHANRELGLNGRLCILTRDPNMARSEMSHLRNGDIEYIAGDVRQLPKISSELTHVIHAATPVQQLWKPETSRETLEICALGTTEVFKLAAQKKSRTLLVSSGAVYGPQPTNIEKIPETYEGQGNSDQASAKATYAEGKRASERIAQSFAETESVDHVVARCFAFVGPHLPLDGGFAAGQFLKNAIDNEFITIKGSGLDQRSYLHTADLAIWLWTILFRGERSETYNVGSDQAISIAHLAKMVGQLVNQVPSSPISAAHGVSTYVPSIEKAKRELGLEVLIPLDDALSRTFRWLKSNP